MSEARSAESDATDHIDCWRLGLRCVDCLPRKAWCDLCVERHPPRDTPSGTGRSMSADRTDNT